MSSQETEIEYRVVAVVLILTILLAVGLALGIGIHKSRSGAASPAAGAAQAAVAGAVASLTGSGEASSNTAANVMPAASAASRSEDASIVVENGVVMFYFATGKADLASGAVAVLGDAIAAAKAGKRLVISGFHDATGDPAFNIELAKRRAMAVRDALVGAGVAASSVELNKPEETTGSGNMAEARRVEVVIAD
ncbi:outer membrane protein OmpA-like peptidoglycan-associated protein [Hydrogenophaga palleronii]|uniref:Outer membrane protein OmpA-like peptidoglycan-associated protein n=1 Tax=Hydrogenophaga palleronii TaxID=65655 RepID=A0ABU1WV56_9BURK|nr:OmpA family protein [Hydrogenophaga palleronii]MDR7153059.1 outer membrane protein OmpA-like peptidoglycan-associated protein [Hydrogenophaga palleronii]